MYLIQQGVLSVADADDAVSYGPGLRWGVMGPSLQWHLGGGAGGIKHFIEHLIDPLAGMMKVPGTPDITPELKQTIIDADPYVVGHGPQMPRAARHENLICRRVPLPYPFVGSCSALA
jgi:hypothetical protein